MRKQNQTPQPADIPPKNPVAKYAYRFNKPQIYADKRKYQRKAKHGGLEPFLIACA